MADSLALPYPVETTNPVPVVKSYGPWADVAAACAGVPLGVRHDGLTVMISGPGEYWWRAADLSDAGLLPKATGAGAPAYDDTAIKQRLGATTPADPAAPLSRLVWVTVGQPGTGNIAKEPIRASTTFGAAYSGNTFGFNINSCQFGNGLNNNTFGDVQINIATGTNFHDNVLGSGLRNVTFGKDCAFNEVGNGVSALVTGNSCSRNIFAPAVTYATLGANCLGNKVDDGCMYVQLGDGCERVTLINCGGVGYSSFSPFMVAAGTKDAIYRNNVLVSSTPGTGGPAGELADDSVTEQKLSPAVRVKLNAIASGGALVPYRTLYLKDLGVKADSGGAMETTQFGTDDHDAVQAALDINKFSGERLRLVGSVDASGQHGFSLVNTGGRILRINPNTELAKCGFLRADGANCKMLLNATGVGMVNTGAGSTLGEPIDHDITITDCIFNGNAFRGSTPYNIVDQTSPLGYSYLVHLAGVNRVNFLGQNRFLNESTFSVMLTNCMNVKGERLYFRCAEGATFQTDGIKIWSCYNVDIDYIQARTFDDAVSVVSNDGLRNDNLNNSANGGHTRYDPYAVYGRCDLVRIRRLVLEGGYGVRLLSGDQFLTNVRVDSIEGWTNQQIVIMGETDQSGMFMKGNLPVGGQYRNISFGRITANCTGKQYYPATIWLAGAPGMSCDELLFDYIYRTNNQVPGLPTIQVTAGFNCDYLTLERMHVAPDANNDNALLQVAGTVSNLNMHNVLNDRALVSAVNGTAGGATLKMQTGGLVRKLTALNWDSNAVTNDIEYNAGTILNVVGNVLDYSGIAFCTIGSGKSILQADMEIVRAYPGKPLFSGLGQVLLLRGYVFGGVTSYNGAAPADPKQYMPGSGFVPYSNVIFKYLGGAVANVTNANAISGAFNVLLDSAGYEEVAVPAGAIGFELIAQTSSTGSISATLSGQSQLTVLPLGTVNVYTSISDGQGAIARVNAVDGLPAPATMLVNNPNGSAYPWAWYRYVAPAGFTLVTPFYISGQSQKFPNEGVNWIY